MSAHDHEACIKEMGEAFDKSLEDALNQRDEARARAERAERQAAALRWALHGLWDNVGTLLAEIHGSGPEKTTLEVVGMSLDKASAALAAYREGK